MSQGRGIPWCMPYAISHSVLTVRALSLMYSQNHWLTRLKGSVNNTLGDVVDLSVHDPYIMSRILVPGLVSGGPCWRPIPP